MDDWMIPPALRLILVFLVGACAGSLVNWAIYALAWNPRPISPWSRQPLDGPARRRADRYPILGWLGLRREAQLHGRGFWVRPLVLEIATGAAFAALYWWEVMRLGLIEGQAGGTVVAPPAVLHWQFASHAVLLCLMAAASFIDIDEKIIPDEITVIGTLIGLILATLVPMSLLPHVAERAALPGAAQKLAVPLLLAGGAPAIGQNGVPLSLEPVTAVAPNEWPPAWGQPRQWASLALAIGCYWLWCFALAPRIWRGRRGAKFALKLIISRLRREVARPPLRWLLFVGTAAIVLVWALGNASWAGLLTALLGLVGSGGIVWAVRLMGTCALRREAMGFGDVTLMMMVGTFLGWQASLIAFFLAPFAGLAVGIWQFVLHRDDVIPYGPYLCLASAAVVVAWAPIWMWGQPMFAYPLLVISVIAVCLALLGVMLAVWQMIKNAIFGSRLEHD
jgi:prepilin signal peptidase PulO-like enzyme (type II secretory pathway)